VEATKATCNDLSAQKSSFGGISMITTPLPPGIDRDQTEHGKLYYTRRQMIEFGQRCADAERNRLQGPIKSGDDHIDFLRGVMGMK